ILERLAVKRASILNQLCIGFHKGWISEETQRLLALYLISLYLDVKYLRRFRRGASPVAQTTSGL
ncbi:MAG: hypothetical protein IJM30_06755, partial [Thermoguttaceae bacterium]|nr:hypothetical protein [Thermoguttaceae bacterium]